MSDEQDFAQLKALGESQRTRIQERHKVADDGRSYALLFIGLRCVYVFADEVRLHLNPLNSSVDIGVAIALLQRAQQIVAGEA